MLRELFLGIDRFDEFRDRLHISRATLTARLGWLIGAGIVRREPEKGPRSRYRFTPAGESLRPTIEAMRMWSETWLPPVPDASGRVV